MCVLCGSDIRSNHPDRPHSDGRAHVKCIRNLTRAAEDTCERSPRAALPVSATQPSIGSQSLRAAALASDDEIRTKSTWRSHRWIVNRAERGDESSTLVPLWTAFALSPNLDSYWIDLHGGGRMIEREAIDRPSLVTHLNPLVERTEAIARSLMRDVGVMEGTLRCTDVQLIHCTGGQGLQRVHFDDTHRDTAKHSITFLFYCTNGPSAAVPLQCHAFAQQAFITGPCDVTPLLSESAQADRVASTLTFRSFAFAPGDSLLFYQDTPHHGCAAPEGGQKVAVYLKFQPRDWPIKQKHAGELIYLRMPQDGPPNTKYDSKGDSSAAPDGGSDESKSDVKQNFIWPLQNSARGESVCS